MNFSSWGIPSSNLIRKVHSFIAVTTESLSKPFSLKKNSSHFSFEKVEEEDILFKQTQLSKLERFLVNWRGSCQWVCAYLCVCACVRECAVFERGRSLCVREKSVCICVCVRERVCVWARDTYRQCVCERECVCLSEGYRQCVCVRECVCLSEGYRQCVCVRERVCVYMCVSERESVYMCVRLVCQCIISSHGNRSISWRKISQFRANSISSYLLHETLKFIRII